MTSREASCYADNDFCVGGRQKGRVRVRGSGGYGSSKPLSNSRTSKFYLCGFPCVFSSWLYWSLVTCLVFFESSEELNLLPLIPRSLRRWEVQSHHSCLDLLFFCVASPSHFYLSLPKIDRKFCRVKSIDYRHPKLHSGFALTLFFNAIPWYSSCSARIAIDGPLYFPIRKLISMDVFIGILRRQRSISGLCSQGRPETYEVLYFCGIPRPLMYFSMYCCRFCLVSHAPTFSRISNSVPLIECNELRVCWSSEGRTWWVNSSMLCSLDGSGASLSPGRSSNHFSWLSLTRWIIWDTVLAPTFTNLAVSLKVKQAMWRLEKSPITAVSNLRVHKPPKLNTALI